MSSAYDARKLSVATEINEVGHQRDYLYEYGTGTKLQTDGPNQRACVEGSQAATPTRRTRLRSSTRSESTESVE